MCTGVKTEMFAPPNDHTMKRNVNFLLTATVLPFAVIVYSLLYDISRYVPSQGDVAVFEALNGAPDAKFINAFRWYNQINSYTSNERLA